MPPAHHTLRVAVAALALSGAIGIGCSSDQDEPSPTTTAAPTTPAPGTSPAAAAATSTPGTAPSGTDAPAPTSAPTTAPAPTSSTPTATPTTPEAYARALYEAWRRGDKTTADTLGTADAVNALFAYEPTDFAFQDCQGAAGSTICTFTAGVGVLEMRVRNATGGEPILVVEVTVTAP